LHASAAAAQTGAKKKPAAGGGGGGGGGSAAPAAEEKFDLTKVVPVNLKKDGSFCACPLCLLRSFLPGPFPFFQPHHSDRTRRNRPAAVGARLWRVPAVAV
jgi:hypothetical protein